jgi:hypothetical protein
MDSNLSLNFRPHHSNFHQAFAFKFLKNTLEMQMLESSAFTTEFTFIMLLWAFAKQFALHYKPL